VSIDPERGSGIVLCGRHPCLDLRRKEGRARIRRNLEREIVIAWAGPVAEELATDRRDRARWLVDATMIDTYVRRCEPTRKAQIELGTRLRLRAAELCREHWSSIDALAGDLTAKPTRWVRRSVDQVGKLFDDHR
jgi:hypothetical protein